MCQFYFGLDEVVGVGEEEKLRSDDQEEKDVDGTREVKHRDAEKRSSRRDVVVVELQPSRDRERKDDKGICHGVTEISRERGFHEQLEGNG